MANSVVTQIIQQGPRNAVVKITGQLDTSDVAATTVVAMADLDQDNTGLTPEQVRIDKIDYSIADQLEVVLEWHATANVVISGLAGRGKIKSRHYGGLQNNAGAGKNGAIDLRTNGYASGEQSFTIILHLVKQGANL